MTVLAPLFTTQVGYRGTTYRHIDIFHAYIPVISIELHNPDYSSPLGYFSIYWKTFLGDVEGIRAISDSYEQLSKKYKLPAGSQKLLEYFAQKFGWDIDAEIIIGKKTTKAEAESSAVQSCTLEDDILEFGLKMDGNSNSVANMLVNSGRIPKDFSFFRINSPYCAYYFGVNPFVSDVKESGLISHLNMSKEIVALFASTGFPNLPIQHLIDLEERLSQMLGYLPVLEKV